MKIAMATLVTVLLATSAAAQTPVPAAPAGIIRDPMSVPAGSYRLDPDHASVIARIPHRGGISLSTYRFNVTSGKLDWNPTELAKTQLSVTVDAASIQSPVAGFAATLAGERFLKTDQFRTVTFVSKAIQKAGPSSAKVTGDLTFMGQTRSVTMDVTLLGATTTRTGVVAGFTGTLRFKRSDFGFTTMMGPIGDDIEMMLDVEFDKPV